MIRGFGACDQSFETDKEKQKRMDCDVRTNREKKGSKTSVTSHSRTRSLAILLRPLSAVF